MSIAISSNLQPSLARFSADSVNHQGAVQPEAPLNISSSEEIISLLDKERKKQEQLNGSHLLGNDKPSLTSPNITITTEKTENLKGYVEKDIEIEEMQSRENSFNAVLKEISSQQEKRESLDFSKFSTEASLLITRLTVMFQHLRESSTKLSSQHSIMTLQSAERSAQSTRNEGTHALNGGIASAALVGSMSIAGAGMAIKGLNAERTAITQNAIKGTNHRKQMQNIDSTVTAGSSPARQTQDIPVQVNRQNRENPNAAARNSLGRNSQAEQGGVEQVNLRPNDNQLSAEDISILKRPSGREADLMDKNDFNFKTNSLMAEKTKTIGNMIIGLSQPLGMVANSTSQYLQNIERADQKLSDVDQTLHSKMYDDTVEKTKENQNSRQAIIDILQGTITKNIDIMAAMAG